ncbi:hypothetical protein MMC14_001563 [Varicellaria rhodocarpa]|nr:hypothetical protein [Varicellaria rhodocarpa]
MKALAAFIIIFVLPFSIGIPTGMRQHDVEFKNAKDQGGTGLLSTNAPQDIVQNIKRTENFTCPCVPTTKYDRHSHHYFVTCDCSPCTFSAGPVDDVPPGDDAKARDSGYQRREASEVLPCTPIVACNDDAKARGSDD